MFCFPQTGKNYQKERFFYKAALFLLDNTQSKE